MQRSSKVIVIVGLMVAAAGALGYEEYTARRVSPFRMWEIRAGDRFAKLDADAERDMHRRFRCRTVEGGVRLCEAETGIAGLMRLAVDSAGESMIVQWRFSDSSLRMTEEARRMAAEWSVVDPRHSRRARAGGRGVTRWVTADSAWSASMTDLTDPRLTRSIDLVDERRVRSLAAGSAAALLRLTQGGYLDRDVLAAELARSPEAVAGAAKELGAPGRAMAASATALPSCAFQGGDSVIAGSEMRSSYGSEDAALLESVIPDAFPGMRLALGQRAYLVDAAGAAEEIRLLPPASDEETFAIAVSFPRRIEKVDQLVRAFGGTAADCRASAVIVSGRRDSSSRAPRELRVADVDEESLTSAVGALEPLPTVSASPSFAVHYRASYGTHAWIGEIDWDATVESHGGDMRVVRRHPAAVGRKDVDDHASAAVAVVEHDAPALMQLTIIRPTGDATPLLLAPGPRGVPSGWMLLDLLP